MKCSNKLYCAIHTGLYSCRAIACRARDGSGPGRNSPTRRNTYRSIKPGQSPGAQGNRLAPQQPVAVVNLWWATRSPPYTRWTTTTSPGLHRPSGDGINIGGNKRGIVCDTPRIRPVTVARRQQQNVPQFTSSEPSLQSLTPSHQRTSARHSPLSQRRSPGLQPGNTARTHIWQHRDTPRLATPRRSEEGTQPQTMVDTSGDTERKGTGSPYETMATRSSVPLIPSHNFPLDAANHCSRPIATERMSNLKSCR